MEFQWRKGVLFYEAQKILVGVWAFPPPRNKPSPVVSVSSRLITTNEKSKQQRAMAFHNSPAITQVREERLGWVKFPHDERDIPGLSCFLTEKDSQNAYLNDLLVAVVAEGLGFVIFAASFPAILFSVTEK